MQSWYKGSNLVMLTGRHYRTWLTSVVNVMNSSLTFVARRGRCWLRKSGTSCFHRGERCIRRSSSLRVSMVSRGVSSSFNALKDFIFLNWYITQWKTIASQELEATAVDNSTTPVSKNQPGPHETYSSICASHPEAASESRKEHLELRFAQTQFAQAPLWIALPLYKGAMMQD
jgi:hypothetical protein